MKLIEIVSEAQWSGSVATKKHPPEDLFSEGSAGAIVKWLKSAHKDLKGAMSALNFYINRAGKNLPAARKAVLDQAKEQLAA
jgi:hypothetical protein